MTISDYTSRPSPWRATRRYWIQGKQLCWEQSGQRGAVPFDQIRQLRLHRTPTAGREMVRCTLVMNDGKKHLLLNHHWQHGLPPGYRSQTEAFDDFLANLLERVARYAPKATYLQGPGRSEWISSIAMFAVSLLLLAGGLLLMAVSGEFTLAPMTLMLVIALCLPVLWPIVRSGGPKPLDPATLKQEREESL